MNDYWLDLLNKLILILPAFLLGLSIGYRNKNKAD